VGESAVDQRLVPGVGRGNVDVQAGRNALAIGKPLEAIETAVQESGETAARLPQCPFEQRVVAAEQDVRARD